MTDNNKQQVENMKTAWLLQAAATILHIPIEGVKELKKQDDGSFLVRLSVGYGRSQAIIEKQALMHCVSALKKQIKLDGVKRVEFRLDTKTLELINKKQQELKLGNKSETLEVLLKPYISA